MLNKNSTQMENLSRSVLASLRAVRLDFLSLNLFFRNGAPSDRDGIGRIQKILIESVRPFEYVAIDDAHKVGKAYIVKLEGVGIGRGKRGRKKQENSGKDCPNG